MANYSIFRLNIKAYHWLVTHFYGTSNNRFGNIINIIGVYLCSFLIFSNRLSLIGGWR